jgi:hypothetical protein
MYRFAAVINQHLNTGMRPGAIRTWAIRRKSYRSVYARLSYINPVMRPLIEDVVAKFSYIRKSLSGFKLRSPVSIQTQAQLIQQGYHS